MLRLSFFYKDMIAASFSKISFVRLSWLLLSLLYLALRFQNTPGVLTDHGVVVNDTDPYYRLHRIAQIVNENWVYPLHDPDLSFPDGFDVPWGSGLDYTIAIPLKLFGIKDKSSIEIYSSISIPFLSLPTLWLTGLTAFFIGGHCVSLTAGFLLTTLGSHIYSSGIGRIDHHFLEALFTSLSLLFVALCRSRKSKRSWLLLGLSLALSPSFWPQAWILSPCVALSFLIDRNSDYTNWRSPVFLFSSLISLIPLALSDRFKTGYISLLGFSWWTPLIYAFLAFLCESLQAIFVKKFKERRHYFVLLFFYLICVVGFLFFKNGGRLVSQTKSAFNALQASQGIIAITTETISPFLLPIKEWGSWGILLLILAWVWFTLQGLNKNRWWLVGFALIPLALCFKQARFFPLASPIIAIGSAAAIFDLTNKFFTHPIWRRTSVTLLTLLIFLPGRPKLGWTAFENVHPFFRSAMGASRFIREERKRLTLPKSESAVLAPWEYGHWILHETNAPVVTHPFQPSSSIEIMKLFLSSGTNRLDEFIKLTPVRYLLIEAPTGRVLRWFKMIGKDPSIYLKDGISESGKPVFEVLPNFNDLFIARFSFLGGQNELGNSPSHWRLIFVSPFASPDHPKMPAMKIYERVKGAVIRAQATRKDLFLVAQILTRDGPNHYRQAAQKGANGFVEWTTPYSMVSHGGVQFDGVYQIETQKGKVLITTPPIQESDILQGTDIHLGKIE